MTHVLTDANFADIALHTDKIVMIDFWATWCPPCIALGPTIDALGRDYADTVVTCKLNADENAQTSVAYSVMNLPCVLFLHQGKVVDKVVGAAPRAMYEKKLKKLLGV